MRPRVALCLLGLLTAFAAMPARADGTVYRASGCGEYVFVTSGNNFSVLQTAAAPTIKDNDALRGEVDRIGTPLLFDVTAGHSVFAQVTERNLTLPEVRQRIAVRCRNPLGENFTSGYVSRSNGCGSRIFVNTPQGYAVLQRISGGVVADGDTLTGNYGRAGRTTVQDKQSGSSLLVFVEDLWLSKSAAERKMTQSCRR